MNQCTGLAYTLLSVCCVILTSITCNAQTYSAGLRGGLQYVMNTTNLYVFRGMEDCGQFSNGNSLGFYTGITGDYAWKGDLLEFSGALYLSYRPAYLEQHSEDNYEVLDPSTSAYVPFERLRTFSSGLTYVALEIGARSRPVPTLPLYARVGFDAGNPILGSSFEQEEIIQSPSAVLFPEGTKARDIGSGALQNLGTAYGATLAVGAVFTPSPSVEFSPEIGFRYGFNSIIGGETWKQSMIMAGVHVRYRFVDDPLPVVEPPPPALDTPQAPIVKAVVDVQAPVQVVDITSRPLEIQETVVTQTYPLLPYLFYDSASSALPAKYQSNESTNRFAEHNLPKKTLDIYYRILDVIGKRMADNTTSVLTVTGTTDGREVPTPEQRIALATARAKSVTAYLNKRWGIPIKRLVIKAVDRPINPTNDRIAEGLEENRRVELSANDISTLAPIVHSRFNEYITLHDRHEFGVRVRNDVHPSSWSLSIERGGKHLWTKSGSSTPPERIAFALDQALSDSIGPIIGTIDSLRAVIVLDGQEGQTASTSFPILKSVNNVELSRLSLIVFDFDQYGISDVNKLMMSKVLTANTSKGSIATIVGSTDRLGEMAYNQTLSEARAKSVAEHLAVIAPMISIASVRGVGPSQLLYDNSLPEGRFYCRTVSLTITTPIGKP